MRIHEVTATQDQPIGKGYVLRDDKAEKLSTKGDLYKGTVVPVEIESLSDLAGRLVAGEPGVTAHFYGRPTVGSNLLDEWQLTTKAGFEAAKDEALEGLMTRTEEHIAWPAAPGVMFLDYDPRGHEAAMAREELWSAYLDAAPALARHRALWWCSSSSFICRESDGVELRGLNGQRTYLLVRDQSDIPRAMEALQKRLWLARYGYILISGAGSRLRRSLVDQVSKEASRLDYTGGAVLRGGLTQRRPDPLLLGEPGAPEVVDTRVAFPDLSDSEEAEYRKVLEDAMADAADAAEAIAKDWTDNRLLDAASANLGAEAAKNDDLLVAEVQRLIDTGAADELEALASGRRHVLPANFVLRLTKDKSITAGELAMRGLISGKDGHMAVCDPLEPAYNGWSLCATAWPRDRNIYSHAHGGGGRYVLCTDEEFRAIWASFIRETVLPKRGDILAEMRKADTPDIARLGVLTAALRDGGDDEAVGEIEAHMRSLRKLGAWNEATSTASKTLARETSATLSEVDPDKEDLDVTRPDEVMESLGFVETVLGERRDCFSYGQVPMRVSRAPVAVGGALVDDCGEAVAEATLAARPTELKYGSMLRLIHRRFNVFSVTADKNGQVTRTSKYAPPQLVSALQETMGEGLPVLRGVVTYPVWVGDGLLNGGSGYDAKTGLWVQADPLEIGEFDSPQDAWRWLRDDLLADFPFESDHDAAVAVAFAMSLMTAKTVLHSEPGPPMFVVTSNLHNSGKTLLLTGLAEAVVGVTPGTRSQPETKEELEKALLAICMANHPCALFDNLPRGAYVGNDKFDEFTTATTHSARILGVSKDFAGPATTVLAFSGNALEPVHDSQSRSLVCAFEVDPDLNMADRTFRHPDFLGHVRRSRGKVLGAFTAILAASTPSGMRLYGRFPAWSEAVAGPLAAASGVNLTEVWRDVGAEDEDVGGQAEHLLPRLKALYAANHKSGSEKGRTEWMTAQEAAAVLSKAHLISFAFDDARRRTVEVTRELKRAKGTRQGDYLLLGAKKNLGARTDNKARWCFQVKFSPAQGRVEAHPVAAE